MIIAGEPTSTSMQQTTVGRHGALNLRFALQGEQTTLPESYFKTPLQVMRAIPDAADCLCVYILSPTGGIVQRDKYDIRIVLEPGTHALITTIAATKVYKMPDACAEQTVHIEVQDGAILEYVPDALILFKNSELHQDLKIHLHDGALCILQDIVMGGRAARQELLQFRRFVNRIQVEDERGLLLLDTMDFAPQPDDLEKIGLLDNFACWASWYLLGDLDAWSLNAKDFCNTHHDVAISDTLFGISTLYRNGLVARMLSNRLEHIHNTFENLRCAYRQLINRPYSDLRR